jgi:hypothetical protein
MVQLIDDLLKLANVTRSEVVRQSVNLSRMAEAIILELREREPSRSVSFILDEEMVVDGDARLLKVMLENLLGNAWKYTGKNDTAEISFRADRTGGETVYCIRDDGVGFDMAYAGTLFGPFQRMHRADEFEGTGIGLATVQRIVSRHGGRIWAEAAVGRGAAFFFTLPGAGESGC